MRKASRKHPIVAIGAAEESIQQALSTQLQIAGIGITRCFVTLDAGDEERDHARKVRALERKYLYSLQDAAYTKQINEVDSDIGQHMTTFYNNLSQPGYAQFLLLHLSRNREQIQEILEALNRQRKHERDHWIHMLDVLRDNGALEPFNLETLRKSVIERLAEVELSGAAPIGVAKSEASNSNAIKVGNGAPEPLDGLDYATLVTAKDSVATQPAASGTSATISAPSESSDMIDDRVSSGTTMMAAVAHVTPAVDAGALPMDVVAEILSDATDLTADSSQKLLAEREVGNGI
jgi:hypothetical protein